MKTFVKKVVPAPMRLQMRVWQRQLADRLAGKSLVLPPVLSPQEQSQFLPRLCLTQALLPTHYSENKRHNLALAMQQLQHRAIAPGQMFSFWRWVGQPNHAKGYREGRSLVGDVLRAEVGGGLCQLSGLIYFLALRAGLQVVERHAHSRDIYTEATRFTPLGSDATVVYGYKDLRLCNSLATPICFQFDLSEAMVKASLCAPEPILECAIEFLVETTADGVMVHTLCGDRTPARVLQTTCYKR
jgi:vancomycin resistance protein VanW